MNNAELKTRARADLKGNYWMAFLTTLIFTIIQYVAQNIGQSIGFAVTGTSIDYSKYMQYIQDGDTERATNMVLEAYYNPATSTIVFIIGVLVTLFVLNHITIGHNKAYVNLSKTGAFNIGDLFGGFKNYGSILKTMFFYDLYLSLWSLLFVIPGIVKTYSYYMVPYILAENPGIDTKRAFEISKQTMNGEKGKAFYMHLSFIGWVLLGVIACCIGVYFVMPYPNATYAQFYRYVKQKSLATGIATPADYAEA